MKRIMEKKVLALIISILLIINMMPNVSYAAEQTISEGTVTPYDISASGLVAGDVLTINTTEPVILTGSNNITIDCIVPGVNLTINNLIIDVSGTVDACALAFIGEGNELTITGTNSLESGANCAGIEVETLTELTIGGDGSIDVIGGSGSAGIGGSIETEDSTDGHNAGTIIISAGTVTATGVGGAGIGGGGSYGEYSTGGTGGNIIISGGIVTAISDGAGIGGGNAIGRECAGGAGGNITISGGIVTATGYNGAAIGGSDGDFHGGAGGNITISGGTVTASSDSGAGIGGGGIHSDSYASPGAGDGGNITISGGIISAKSSRSGAGIGGGANRYGGCEDGAGGNISISGGFVFAQGGSSFGQDIGGGYTNTSGNLTISGNSEVFLGKGDALIPVTLYRNHNLEPNFSGFANLIGIGITYGFTSPDSWENLALKGYFTNFSLPIRKSDISATTIASVIVNNPYTLDLSTIFEDVNGDPLTYEVSINGQNYISADESYSYLPPTTTAVMFEFRAYDGNYYSTDTYTVVLTINGSYHNNTSTIVNEHTETTSGSTIIPDNLKGKDEVIIIEEGNVTTKLNGSMFANYKNQKVEFLVQRVSSEYFNLNTTGEFLEDVLVYDLSILIDGVIIPFASNMPIEIEIAIDSNLEPHKVVMVYLNNNGEVEILDGIYDGKVMRFTTNHLSNYGVMYMDQSFTDITNHWAREAIEALAARGVVNGTSDTTFMPDATITRAEFVTLVVRYFDLLTFATDGGYSDVVDDSWYRESVLTAKELGILPENYGNLFQPNLAITREDMMYILYEALVISGGDDRLNDKGFELADFNDIMAISDYALRGATYLVSRDIIHGASGSLDPKGTASRGQVAQMLYNLIQEFYEE